MQWFKFQGRNQALEQEHGHRAIHLGCITPPFWGQLPTGVSIEKVEASELDPNVRCEVCGSAPEVERVFEIHLLGLDEEEAEACLTEHGRAKCCLHRGCTAELEMQVMFKTPGAAWCQEVWSIAACKDHRSSLDEHLAKFPIQAGT